MVAYAQSSSCLPIKKCWIFLGEVENWGTPKKWIQHHRVLKWWRHKNEISEIMGFVKIFWKNNVQEAYLPKMSISGQIVSEIVAQLYSEISIQTLLIFFGVDPKKV